MLEMLLNLVLGGFDSRNISSGVFSVDMTISWMFSLLEF